MNLFPYESWELKSSLNISRLVDGIARRIEQPKFIRGSLSYCKPFEGKVCDNGFTINRIVCGHSNPFVPVLNGKFIQTERGTFIRIKMTLESGVWMFMIIYFGIIFLFMFKGIKELIDGNSKDWSIIPSCIITAFFMITLTLTCFRIEARKARNFINDLFIELDHPACKLDEDTGHRK